MRCGFITTTPLGDLLAPCVHPKIKEKKRGKQEKEKLFAILDEVNMLSLVTSVSENKTDQAEFSLPYACVSHSASWIVPA